MHDAGSRGAQVRYSYETRRRAVQLMLDGLSAPAAAASVGASPDSGYRWLARYRADGWAGLRERPSPPWRRTLVEAIAGYRAERGYPPSILDLVERTGASSTSVVWYRLAVCERQGLLVREPWRSRTVVLTAAGRALAGSPPERAAAGDAPAGERAA